MYSPARNKSKKNQAFFRSPSIPTEIGPGGENFHAYFLEDSGESDRSSSRLGISRPSYGSPDKLDFSPVLHSTRKRTVIGKSALDKYQASPAATTSISSSHSSPYNHDINNIRSRSSTPSEAHSKNNDTVKQSNQTKETKPSRPSAPAEQAVRSPFRSFRQKQRNRALRKSEQKAARVANSKTTASPYRNPIKALKLHVARSTHSSASLPVQNKASMSTENYEHDSCSNSEMDGSIDLHRSFPTQHENAMRTNGHNIFFNNERFFTPAQQSGFTGRSYHVSHPSSHSSASSIVSTDTPLLNTHPLASTAENQGQSLGIVAAPKSSTKRIIVPHVQPSKTKNIYTIFVLLVQPSQKIFELVRLNYNPTKATLRKLLGMIPSSCTEEDLSNQVYTGFCRPNASSSSNKGLSNLSLTASVMTRDGSCARIVCGEVLAAIPEGYTSKETQILARHIMKNPKMMKLLSKKNPLSRSRNRRTQKRTKKGDNNSNNSSSKGHLGIQPRNSLFSTVEDDTQRVSSAVMFTPLTDTIVEETLNESMANNNDYGVKRRIQSPKGKLAAKLERDNSENLLISGDNSCNSSLTSIHSLRRKPLVQKIVTNIEMKHNLNNLEETVENFNSAPKQSKKLPQSVAVADDDVSQKDATSSKEVSLSASQLDAIKREAAEAARTAAEEAFSKRMEELVQTLDVSEEEKNRLLENDDMSYHSAFSFAMNGSFASIAPTKETCDFPVSVTISAQNPPPVVESSFLSPHGSYGAYASECTLTSPYAPVSGVRLLTPLSVSQRLPGPTLTPLPQMASPETTESFSPKAVDPLKFSDSMRKHQEVINSTMNTTITQSSDEGDDDMEMSLISEAMEGFYNVSKTAVSKFIERRKKSLSKLPSKIMQGKLHLKVMSIVCLLFLSSQNMNNTNSDDDKDFNNFFNVDNNYVSSPEDDAKKSFSILDLQQILFWFLILTKGQHFLSENRPRRRRRRAWKSRIVPVKKF